jgi:hypothetical protein
MNCEAVIAISSVRHDFKLSRSVVRQDVKLRSSAFDSQCLIDAITASDGINEPFDRGEEPDNGDLTQSLVRLVINSSKSWTRRIDGLSRRLHRIGGFVSRPPRPRRIVSHFATAQIEGCCLDHAGSKLPVRPLRIEHLARWFILTSTHSLFWTVEFILYSLH